MGEKLADFGRLLGDKIRQRAERAQKLAGKLKVVKAYSALRISATKLSMRFDKENIPENGIS